MVYLKNFYIYLFIFIFLFSGVVIAQPPGQEFGALTIVYPKIEYIGYQQVFKFHVHVYDSLGVLLDNSQVECNIHIYADDGSHEVEAVMQNDSNNIDKEYVYNHSLYNDIGEHTVLIFCEETGVSPETGAISEPFTVTYSGENNSNYNISFSFIGIILMFLGFSAISLWISTRFNDNEYKPLRMSFFWMSIINILIMIGYFALYTTCVNTGCSEYGRFNSFGEGLFLIYGLFTIYVLWNYTYIKLKKTKEDWFK